MSGSDSSGKVFNIGGMWEVKIIELTACVRELLNSESKIMTIPYSETYALGFEDMYRRVPNTRRISSLLNWNPCRFERYYSSCCGLDEETDQRKLVVLG